MVKNRRVVVGLISGLYGLWLMSAGIVGLISQNDPNAVVPLALLIVFGAFFLFGAAWIERLIKSVIRKLITEPAKVETEKFTSVFNKK